jgi:2-oxoglutarate dehydrogenase E1 component
MRAEQTSFLFGANAPFMRNSTRVSSPTRVRDAEWQTFFGALAEQKGDVLAEVRGASWAPNGARVIGAVDPDAVPAAANRNVKGGKTTGGAAPAAPVIVGKTQEEIRAAAQDTARALMLIRAYRIRGHLEADLDPLGLVRQAPHRELDPATYGFTDADWDRPILIFGSLALGESATLRQIMERLRKTYCGKIGVEFMHISDPDQKAGSRSASRADNHTEFTVTGAR